MRTLRLAGWRWETQDTGVKSLLATEASQNSRCCSSALERREIWEAGGGGREEDALIYGNETFSRLF